MNIPPLQPDVAPKKADTPASKPDGPACMNCGATLQAKFCHVCGQRKQRRVVSLFLLAGDFIQELFDIESRLWRTLWPLFARPGHLTRSYIDGQRERYVPPVRLYLISSIVFFLLVSMSPRNMINEATDHIVSMKGVETSKFSQGKDSPLSGESITEFVETFKKNKEEDDASSNDAVEEGETSTDGVTTSVIENREVVGTDEEPPNPQVESDTDTVNPDVAEAIAIAEAAAKAAAEDSDTVFSLTVGDSDEGNITEEDLEGFELVNVCEDILKNNKSVGFEPMRLPIYRGCMSISTWGGFLDFLSDFIDDLPKTLFILLPLMALVNKLLYLFAGRHYVEHLLHYVHNYSFLFLFSVLLTGISKLAALAGVGNAVTNLLIPLGFLYTIYYFFKSMRVVYGQGFFFTFSKWIALVIVFFMLVSVIIVFFTLAAAAVHGI